MSNYYYHPQRTYFDNSGSYDPSLQWQNASPETWQQASGSSQNSYYDSQSSAISSKGHRSSSARPDRVLHEISTISTEVKSIPRPPTRPPPTAPCPPSNPPSTETSRNQQKSAATPSGISRFSQQNDKSTKATGSNPLQKNHGLKRLESADVRVSGSKPAGRKDPEAQPPAYRYQPYVFTKLERPSQTFRLAPNRDILVVNTKTDSTSLYTNVINIRKPTPTEASSDYSASPHVYISQYESTVSNRLGLSGPDSLYSTHNQAAHSAGIGKYLLQKMGWSPGSGIGPNPQADSEPLAAKLEYKADKKGLGTTTEGGGGLSDVHLPVGYLNEMCLMKGWKFPNYELVDESGPPHAKSFLFKVTLNGVEYSANDPATTKKAAKANAARVVLRALGVMNGLS